MPIRTNRGRAAVYRRLWGWPMRSPTHFAMVLVAVAVLVIATSVIVPQLTGSARGGSGAGAETTEENAGSGDGTAAPGTTEGPSVPGGQGGGTTSLPTRIESPPRPSSAEPEPEALDVVAQWGEAWVNHPEGTSQEEWLDGLRPFTTAEYMVKMETVDPENVPATEVTGEPEAKESYTSSLTAHLPTDGGTIAVTVISTPEGWRVVFYEQVSPR
ncbi:hypothetical protein [Actinophytocola xanthii]|uniref:Uncharacterized protein n=1 Tax=Actinophytocola xanthii TaxID=1912961 RepID=A0A1Q8C3H1_9PSEU|nr:hypothetical protein [Actinophytocola xanthii]OLF08907.1 hypothetical protein BU204_33820 [Actinophytocola xanthii]